MGNILGWFLRTYKNVVMLKILLKFTLNKYHRLTAMYRIYFERPCRKIITDTYTIFNREHAGVTHVNVYEFRGNQSIFTGVIVRADRQTDKPKPLTLFNFSWKVLKIYRNNHLTYFNT